MCQLSDYPCRLFFLSVILLGERNNVIFLGLSHRTFWARVLDLQKIRDAASASLQTRSNLLGCSSPALWLLCVNDASFLGHTVVKNQPLKSPIYNLSAQPQNSWALLWLRSEFLSASQDLLHLRFPSNSLSSDRDYVFHPPVSNVAGDGAFLLELPVFSRYYHAAQVGKKLFPIICQLVNSLPDSKSFDQDCYTVYIGSSESVNWSK